MAVKGANAKTGNKGDDVTDEAVKNGNVNASECEAKVAELEASNADLLELQDGFQKTIEDQKKKLQNKNATIRKQKGEIENLAADLEKAKQVITEKTELSGLVKTAVLAKVAKLFEQQEGLEMVVVSSDKQLFKPTALTAIKEHLLDLKGGQLFTVSRNDNTLKPTSLEVLITKYKKA